MFRLRDAGAVIVPGDHVQDVLEAAAERERADAAESATLVREVLSGQAGARRDMVLLNGGAALLAAGKAEDLAGGVKLAAEIIDSGAALKKLDELVAFCRA